MLIYQPNEVLISVLYLYNTLTVTKHSGDKSHMMNQSSSQAAFPQAEKDNTNI